MVEKEPTSMTDNPELDKALSVLGGLAHLGSETPQVEVIPTDLDTINDVVFGCGGIPRGKVIELYAKESVGKSTFAYWLAGQVQKRGFSVALFDGEGAYVPNYGAGCGINNDILIMPEFYHGEQALGQIKMLLATGTIDLIIVDAMPSLQPLVNLEQVAGEKVTMKMRLERAAMYQIFFNDIMGGFKIKSIDKGAKFIKNADGDLKHKIYNTKTTIIFINHAKDKIGVMFGERTKTPCGEGINFASSLRLGMSYINRKTKTVDKKKVLDYKVIAIRAVKNKVAIPFGETRLKMFTDGHFEQGPEKKSNTGEDEELE